MSKFLNYAALILAIAIVFLLVRGPIDWSQLAVSTDWATDSVEAVSVDPTEQSSVQPVAIDIALGDVAAGAERYRRSCAACHSTKPQGDGVGPSLYGVINRQAGSFAGFEYSSPMEQLDLVWNAENLGGYLTRPTDFLPGTSMAFVGLNDPQDIADIIAYLDAIAVN